MTRRYAADTSVSTDKEPGWVWRNCRSVGVRIGFWPLNWTLSFHRTADVYGGAWTLLIGPFEFQINASIGNNSSENRFEAWLGLSEAEAYERARAAKGE